MANWWEVDDALFELICDHAVLGYLREGVLAHYF